MIELGNLDPLRELAEGLKEWETQVRARPLPDGDPVVQTIGAVRTQLAQALAEAGNIELELSADQYAKLRGWTMDKLYKMWQRGKLPEAHRRGGKIVVPVSALERDAA